MPVKGPNTANKRERVSCLRCNQKFLSPDKRHVRLCPKCSEKKV